jgi:hypothetical protein
MSIRQRIGREWSYYRYEAPGVVFQIVVLLTLLHCFILVWVLGDFNRDSFGFTHGNRLLGAEFMSFVGFALVARGSTTVPARWKSAVVGIVFLSLGSWQLGEFFAPDEIVPCATERVADAESSLVLMHREGRTDAYKPDEWDRLLTHASAELRARQLELRAAMIREVAGYPRSRTLRWYLRMFTGINLVAALLIIWAFRSTSRSQSTAHGVDGAHPS